MAPGASREFRHAATGDVDERWDVVLDVFARRSLTEWQRILSPTGRYRMVGGSARRILSGFVRGRMMSEEGGQDLGLLFGWPHTRQDMDEVNALIEAGQLRPVIGSRYPLEEAAAALQELKEGRVIGKAMLDIGTLSPKPFAELTEQGQARRLRPLAESRPRRVRP